MTARRSLGPVWFLGVALLTLGLNGCLDESKYQDDDGAGALPEVVADAADWDDADPGGIDQLEPSEDVLLETGEDLSDEDPGDSESDELASEDVTELDGAEELVAPAIPERSCETTFVYHDEALPYRVSVAGEWNDWALQDMALVPGSRVGGSEWSLALPLAVGVHAYRIVVQATAGGDSAWLLDPENPYRKWHGELENSGARVGDCHVPLLITEPMEAPALVEGLALAQARFRFLRAAGGPDPDPASVAFSLSRNGLDQALDDPASTLSEGGVFGLELSALEPGKYTLLASAADLDGVPTEPARAVFWVEEETFDWRDTPLYMVMIDRFRDGEPANNATPTPGAEPSTDWYGGDLQGVTQAIEEGVFEALGVRALWISPWNVNPAGAHLAGDGLHGMTGYHGYWPIDSRGVDPRFGGDEALDAMIRAAHARGIRVMMDLVLNHVHEQHPAFLAHPDWFNTGCLCGQEGCGWTEHRLDCLFAPYMPDIDWRVTAAADAFIDDALYWLDRFDLDGFRVDAVKHVPDLAVANLSTRISEGYERAGTEVFLLGETAMGWGGHDVADSLDDYETISRYIGPNMLNGQFDFVLYHAVATKVWAYDDFDAALAHPDYWLQQSLLHYPADAIMTPYIGSHDTARFVTSATYRGQDEAHAQDIAHHSYPPLPEAPTDREPYERMRTALTWLLTIPGLPLLYYGDEYGQFGGHDPDNRRWWRPEADRSEWETWLYGSIARLGTLRASLPALRRGEYLSLKANGSFLAYARRLGDDLVVVALNHSNDPVSEQVTLPQNYVTGPEGPVENHLVAADGASLDPEGLLISLPGRGVGVYVP